MLRFGIYRPHQLEEPTFRKILKSGRRISINLYHHAQTLAHADEIAEAILLLFSDDRGAYKRTYQNRFEEFDKTILAHLKSHFSTEELLTVHDVAVSDGRTALDFFRTLSDAFTQLQYTASDYNPKVYIIKKGKMHITLSHSGRVLEILLPPFVFNMIRRDSLIRYPLNYILRFLVHAVSARPLVQQYKQGLIQAEELMLFAPKVLKEAEDHTNFKLQQHNILTPLETQLHVIRAMNILNPSYFSAAEFQTVLTHLHAGLKDQGLLITGSNQDAGSIVNGGLYQKVPTGFQKIIQSGNGSPIERLILDFNPS